MSPIKQLGMASIIGWTLMLIGFTEVYVSMAL